MNAEWSKSAKKDLRRITAFYRQIDPEISADMRLRIDAGVQRLCAFPMFGSPAPDGKRTKWRIPRTDFLIFFRIVGNLIVIDEVVHAREDWAKYDRP